MTLTDAERLKNLWASIFRRKGRDGAYTRLFDNLDEPRRNTLLSVLKLHESELPVIGSVQDSDNWFVLTTERLVWSIGGTRQDLPANTVREIKVDLKRSQSKLEMQRLKVVTMDDDEFDIELEPGAPLSGVWHVLNNLWSRNRRVNQVT